VALLPEAAIGAVFTASDHTGAAVAWDDGEYLALFHTKHASGNHSGAYTHVAHACG